MNDDELVARFFANPPRRERFSTGAEYETALKDWNRRAWELVRVCKISMRDLPAGGKISTSDGWR